MEAVKSGCSTEMCATLERFPRRLGLSPSSGAPSAAGASALDCFFSNAGIAFMRYAMASDTTNSRSVSLFS